MITVWAVEWGSEFPAEVDSLWTTQDAARERAKAKNAEDDTSSWSAQPWVARDEPEAE